jgi:hypothetical protein
MTTRPPPRFTFDERGIILHMTGKAGEPIELSLNPDQLVAMLAQGQRVIAELATERGKLLAKQALKGFVGALLKGDD